MGSPPNWSREIADGMDGYSKMQDTEDAKIAGNRKETSRSEGEQ